MNNTVAGYWEAPHRTRVKPKVWDGVILHHSGLYFWGGKLKEDKDYLYSEDIDRKHTDGIVYNGKPLFGWKKGNGYHFVINPNGKIQVTMRWLEQWNGAHAKGHPNTIGICFIGDFNKKPFDDDECAETGVMAYSGQGLLFTLIKDKLISNIDRVIPHHQLSADKTCPGKLFNLHCLYRDVYLSLLQGYFQVRWADRFRL